MKSLFFILPVLFLFVNQNVFAQTYDLPIAGKYTLGGVKIGEGLNIGSSGDLSIKIRKGLKIDNYGYLCLDNDTKSPEIEAGNGILLNDNYGKLKLSIDKSEIKEMFPTSSEIKKMILNESNLGRGLEIDPYGRLSVSKNTSSASGNIRIGRGLDMDQSGIVSVNKAQIKEIVQQGIFLYTLTDDKNNVEFWIANNDGSDNKRIATALPSGSKAIEGNLTPNGKILIFSVKAANNMIHIYSCAIDGSNLKKIVDGGSVNKIIKVVGAY